MSALRIELVRDTRQGALAMARTSASTRRRLVIPAGIVISTEALLERTWRRIG